MRPLVIVGVLLGAVAVALLLTALSIWSLTAALILGFMGLLGAAVIGVRQQPPKFRWVAAVGLGGLLTGVLLWNLIDYSPFTVRIHNASSRTMTLSLAVGHRLRQTFQVAPGQTVWRVGSLSEGVFVLDCDDGAGPRTVLSEGYVTSGETLTATVDLPSCAAAKASSQVDLIAN